MADLEAIRRRLDWLRDNEEQCHRSPGQVSMAGYAAAAIDCGRDVPALLAEVERLGRENDELRRQIRAINEAKEQDLIEEKSHGTEH